MKAWLAQVAAVAIGARIAIFWHDVNETNAALHVLRGSVFR